MIRLSNPTGRNTPAHVVTIGQREYFFSYETCIAYRGPGSCSDSWRAIRIANHWGPTTGRHFTDLGCKNFETVDDAAFNSFVESTLENTKGEAA